MSNEKNPGCLGYIGDYTTQLCGGYNKPLYKDPWKTTSIMESKASFFRGSYRLLLRHVAHRCIHTPHSLWLLPKADKDDATVEMDAMDIRVWSKWLLLTSWLYVNYAMGVTWNEQISIDFQRLGHLPQCQPLLRGLLNHHCPLIIP